MSYKYSLARATKPLTSQEMTALLKFLVRLTETSQSVNVKRNAKSLFATINKEQYTEKPFSTIGY